MARRSARRAPDLTILGKVVGGGLPLAAFGGRAEVMSLLAPAGDVYQAGTLSGNPLATAAGLSVLRSPARPGVFGDLDARAARLEAGLRDAAPNACVQRFGSLLTLFLAEGRFATSTAPRLPMPRRYGTLFRVLLERGVYVPPSPFEAWFVSLAHGDEEIDATVTAVADVLR